MSDTQQNITNNALNQGSSLVQGDNTGQHIAVNYGSAVQNIHLPKPAEPPRQLRAPVADFMGREQEIAALTQALTASDRAAVAICGVRGMGGVGKTELALVVANQLAEQYPDGQIVIELFGTLNPISPEHAVQEAIRAFDREAKLPDDLPSLQALYRQQCSSKRVLVLADDAKDEAQVRPLLPPAGCALLITSRPPIVLPGMHTHKLDTLLPAEAEKLLRDMCQHIGNDAPELARLCGYLPLALRVSATFLKRRPNRPVATYLQNLRDEQSRLAHLRDPKDPTLNVEASLALSYDALPPKVQQAFAQLGVFVGSFTLEAAEAVVEVVGNTAAELLEELYLSSLLDYDEGSDRYALHDLVRVFALARLDDERPVRLRHARHYQRIATQSRELYREGGEHTLAGLAHFDTERQQIDAVWNWVMKQVPSVETDTVLVDFADATAYIGTVRYRLHDEKLPRLEAQLAVARRRREEATQATALNNLCKTHNQLGNHHIARGYGQEALVIFRTLQNHRGESAVLCNLGISYRNEGDQTRAIQCLKQALETALSIDDPGSIGYALGLLGAAHLIQYNYIPAIEYTEKYLLHAQQAGDRVAESTALGNLGLSSHFLGDYHTAINYYRQAHTIDQEIGNQEGVARHSWNLGLVYEVQGDLARAVGLMQVAVDFFQQIGHENTSYYAEYLEQMRQRLCEQGD